MEQLRRLSRSARAALQLRAYRELYAVRGVQQRAGEGTSEAERVRAVAERRAREQVRALAKHSS